MFDQLSEKLRATIKSLGGQARLTEKNIADSMREVRVALLEADVSLEVTRKFTEDVKARALGAEVTASLQPGQVFVGIVRDELVRLMGNANDRINLSAPPPAVIFVAGLQGAGKTTTVGKLGRLIRSGERRSVIVVSADIYRPAAIDQLRTLANELELDFYPSDPDQKPVDIVHGALDHAARQGIDVVIVDTAGRLHIDHGMMSELQELHRAARPVETLFVVDSMTGQDAINSAKAFDQALPLSGVILTKTDGDARGGAALSIRQVTGKPIKFLGTGEGMDALEPFHPDRVASRILGMGDVLSLIEEVEQKVDRGKAEKLARKITTGKKFDLEDFREQMMQLQNMGGMMGMLDKLPGMNRLPQKAVNRMDDRQTARVIAIVNSMTPHERKFPAVIRNARKKRIAAGSGTRVQDVNRLLKQFAQMQKMMGRMNRKGGMKGMLDQMRGGNLLR